MKNALLIVGLILTQSTFAADKKIIICQADDLSVSIYDYEHDGVRAALSRKPANGLRTFLIGMSSPIVMKPNRNNSTMEYTGPNFALVVTFNSKSLTGKGTGVVKYERLNRKIYEKDLECSTR